MALRQLFSVGQSVFLCRRPITYNKFFKNVRHFKRNKDVVKKIETESLQVPFKDCDISPDSLRFGLLWKPFAFTIVFSSSCFIGAAIWQYEHIRSQTIRVVRQPIGWFQKKTVPYKTGSIRREINAWWNSLTQSEKMFVPICAANILVFLAWRIPQFQPVMMKYFCSNPVSQVLCWPMFLSTFSHYSGVHILANMYVLHSFCTGAVERLGKEQFLGFYLSAGVISSFTSYVYKIASRQAGYSLGASGAIMAILGYICTEYPDTQLGIIFLPFFTFPAEAALKFIMGFDLTGLILGWKIFDHAAHLGGAACGIAWCYWGRDIWSKRENIIRYWHNVRGEASK